MPKDLRSLSGQQVVDHLIKALKDVGINEARSVEGYESLHVSGQKDIVVVTDTMPGQTARRENELAAASKAITSVSEQWPGLGKAAIDTLDQARRALLARSSERAAAPKHQYEDILAFSL